MTCSGIYKSEYVKQVLPPIVQEQIVELLGARDPLGLRLLHQYYSQALRLVISRILRKDRLTEEVLHQTYAKAWYSIHLYQKDKGRLFTWLVCIARNLTLDMLRKEAKHNEFISNEDDYTSPYIQHTYLTVLNVDRIGLKALVFQLDPKHREIIVLQFFEGFTQAEIAEHLRIPLGTVKTRCYKGLQQLKYYFSEAA